MATTYTTGQDIYADVYQRSGIKNASSEKLQRFVSRAYNDLLMVADWPWALKDPAGVLNVPDAVTDTVTITTDTTSAIITTDSGTTDMSGWKLLEDTNQKEYRIVTHSGTTATLDANWNEATAAAAACKIYKDEYSLAADCLQPWTFYDRTNGNPLDFQPTRQMAMEKGPNVVGTAILSVSLIASLKVKIKPFVPNAATIVYRYTELQNALTFDGVAGTDTPVVPLPDRHVIADMAYRLTLKDWVQSEEVIKKITDVEAEILEKIQAMKDFWINVGSSYGSGFGA